ncbi:MAG TPA: hypothetical protein VIV11_11565 [Kofleriaceae bacterium]
MARVATMLARSCVLAGLAGCYDPDATVGAPCSQLVTCPEGQSCALVDGRRICVVEVAPDGGGPSQWTLVQTRSNTSLSNLPIAAVGAKHAIIVAIETDVGAVTSVIDNAGSVYLPVAGSRAINTTENLGIELWYTASSNAGATTITASAPMIWAIASWEVAGLSNTSPLGAVAKLDNQPATTSPAGASITTAGAGEFVVSIAIVANTVSGLSSGSAFTNDHVAFGNGWAHLTSATAPAGTYQAQWSQPTAGTFCSASAGFRLGP